MNVDKPHILVVEDDEQFRTLLRYFLEPNYFVVAASNGEEALDVLKKQRIDLVFTDIVMPLITGIELLKTIKSEKEFAHIPVIILLATADANDIKAMKMLHADGVILKEDVSRSALVSLIQKHLA